MRVSALVGAVLLGVCAVSACTPTPAATPSVVSVPSVSVPAPSPSPSESPSPSLSPTEQAVIATIRGYYESKDYLLQHPEDGVMTRIQKWTTGEQIMMSVSSVVKLRQRGVTLAGSTIVRDIRVGAVKNEGGLDTCVVTFCEDLTKSGLRKDGKPVDPVIPTGENVVTLRLIEGQWLIDTIRDGRKGPC